MLLIKLWSKCDKANPFYLIFQSFITAPSAKSNTAIAQNPLSWKIAKDLLQTSQSFNLTQFCHRTICTRLSLINHGLFDRGLVSYISLECGFHICKCFWHSSFLAFCHHYPTPPLHHCHRRQLRHLHLLLISGPFSHPIVGRLTGHRRVQEEGGRKTKKGSQC